MVVNVAEEWIQRAQRSDQICRFTTNEDIILVAESVVSGASAVGRVVLRDRKWILLQLW